MSAELFRLAKLSEEAWNTNNFDYFEKWYAPDIVYHLPPFPDIVGLEAFRQYFDGIQTAYPGALNVYENIITEGDLGVPNRTALRFTWTGTFLGPSASIPIPPTGKTAVCTGVAIVHGDGKKTVEVWQIGDWLGMLIQHGVMPPLG